MSESEGETEHKSGIKKRITGLGQVIIGEIESLAGVVNADPLAQAEGEFLEPVQRPFQSLVADRLTRGLREQPVDVR